MKQAFQIREEVKFAVKGKKDHGGNEIYGRVGKIVRIDAVNDIISKDGVMYLVDFGPDFKGHDGDNYGNGGYVKQFWWCASKELEHVHQVSGDHNPVETKEPKEYKRLWMIQSNSKGGKKISDMETIIAVLDERVKRMRGE